MSSPQPNSKIINHPPCVLKRAVPFNNGNMSPIRRNLFPREAPIPNINSFTPEHSPERLGTGINTYTPEHSPKRLGTGINTYTPEKMPFFGPEPSINYFNPRTEFPELYLRKKRVSADQRAVKEHVQIAQQLSYKSDLSKKESLDWSKEYQENLSAHNDFRKECLEETVKQIKQEWQDNENSIEEEAKGEQDVKEEVKEESVKQEDSQSEIDAINRINNRESFRKELEEVDCEIENMFQMSSILDEINKVEQDIESVSNWLDLNPSPSKSPFKPLSNKK